MEGLPVTLVVKNRRCIVVGGGAVAARKADLLLRAEASVAVVAPHLGAELEALAAAGRIRHSARGFVPRDLAGAALAVAATGNRAVNAAVAAAAGKRGIPVNVVDDPALCLFTMPAIVERGRVSVAIATGGASPTLARRLRAEIERALPPRVDALAAFAAAHRQAVKAALPGVEARRRFWDDVLDGPVAAAVLAGEPAAAERWLHASLARCAAAPRRGRVALVGAGPGDPELLTLKALRLLERADAIVYDALVGEGILDRARRDAERIFVGKRKGAACLPQHEINALLVRLARQGKRVIRLKGGDPFMFGRGGEECHALRAAGIDCEVVPGITAALGCAAAAGIPLTHRDHAQACVFVTAHRRNGRLDLDWRGLARPRQTLCIYMGLSVVGELMARLIEAGLRRGTPAALIESGTTRRQRVIAGTVANLAERAAAAGLGGPAMLIVGEVAVAAAVAPSEKPIAAETDVRARSRRGRRRAAA